MENTVLNYFNNLLEENKPNSKLYNLIKKDYRSPIADAIKNQFPNEKINFRYGGSLAKGTANKKSSDIDLLVYFDKDTQISVKNIYNGIENALNAENYIFQAKNNAICVTGQNWETWEYSVDVVPGKYIDNDDGDVYLWCRKDESRLKTNPDKQINKVKESKCVNLIRLIKLFRDNNNFKFRSFYLEIFAIDIAKPDFDDNASIYDELITFCKHYDEIGVTKIYDPANKDNDIMKIHSDIEFIIIKNHLKKLLEALYTNNIALIKNIFDGSYIDDNDIDNAYLEQSQKHASEIKLKNVYTYFVQMNCREKGTKNIAYGEIVTKRNKRLIFEISFNFLDAAKVEIIISNSGYEADKMDCLRGKRENTVKTQGKYYREEPTAYYGNHYAQAVVTTKSNKEFYSEIFVVKIRD